MSSVSGPVAVRLPRGLGYQVRATSTSGPRLVDPAPAGGTGTAARGPDRHVDVHTGSGPVSVQYPA